MKLVIIFDPNSNKLNPFYSFKDILEGRYTCIKQNERTRELRTNCNLENSLFHDTPTGKANPGKSPIITLLNCHQMSVDY